MDIHRVYKIFQEHFRPKRMALFAGKFRLTHKDEFLDIGGSTLNWSFIKVKPKVVIANLDTENINRGRFSFRKLDATQLPFESRYFNIAYSNSVIEHVGDWQKQQQFADEVRRVAKYYYIQTPYRWFFIEPHFIAPLIHFLPRNFYRRLIPYCSIWYWLTKPGKQQFEHQFEEINLLDKKQMRRLFPDAELIEEKFLFFTKSLIAIRAPQHNRHPSDYRHRAKLLANKGSELKPQAVAVWHNEYPRQLRQSDRY